MSKTNEGFELESFNLWDRNNNKLWDFKNTNIRCLFK